MSRASQRLLGAAAGLVADRVLGEPAVDPHPVALLGSTLAALERRTYDDRRAAGVVHAAAGLVVGAIGGRLAGTTATATYLACAGRMLGDVALDITFALDAGDLPRARAALPALVGRDPSTLDEAGVVAAVVESVAENTVDAVVAPALWAAVLGAPGAGIHKAASTLDSMVGHRNERYAQFGWASARVDDAMAWVPARVTAALVAAVRPRSAARVAAIVRRDAGEHPSPNAGVAEAAFAAALGLRLGGGAVRYGDVVQSRATLGDGRPPERADIAAAVRLSRDVALTLAGALATTGLLLQRRN